MTREDDFATWVGGQERQLLRSAYLVRGDLDAARRHLRAALTALAVEWHAAEPEDAGLTVRTRLYADLLAEPGPVSAGVVTDPFADRAVGEGERRPAGPDVWAALGAMEPVSRAALVLRHFEHRGEPTVVAVLRPRRGVEVPNEVPEALRGHDLSALLERASQDVPSPDLVGETWRSASRARSRRRRRTLAAVAVVAVAVVGVALGTGRGGDGGRDRASDPTPSPLVTRGRTLDGLAYLMAPEVGTERAVPSGTVLPPELDLDGPARAYTDLSEGERSAMVAALVTLRDLDGTGSLLQPRVLTRDGSLVDLDVLSLQPAVDLDGNWSSPLSAGAVSADGTRILFARAGTIVLLDLPSDTIRVAEVPSQGLDEVGWGVGEVGIIASDDRGSWFVDATTMAVTPLPQRSSPGPYRLVADAQGQRPTILQRWDSRGLLRDDPLPLGRTFRELTSDTVSTVAGSAAVAVAVDPATFGPTALEQNVINAILVVQASDPRVRSALAFGDTGGVDRPLGCCTPLGWATGSQLLFVSRSSEDTWIMLWDTRRSTVSSVARVRGLADQTFPQLALGRVR